MRWNDYAKLKMSDIFKKIGVENYSIVQIEDEGCGSNVS